MNSKILAIILVGVMVGMGLGYTASLTFGPKSTTTASNPVILDRTKDPSATNIAPEHQHQNTLNPNGRMTGRVLMLEKIVEGESEKFHFLVVPDTSFKDLLNDANRQNLSGAMMVEIYNEDMGILPRLHIGQHLELKGPYVVDNDNYYNEIDPALFIKDLGV